MNEGYDGLFESHRCNKIQSAKDHNLNITSITQRVGPMIDYGLTAFSLWPKRWSSLMLNPYQHSRS